MGVKNAKFGFWNAVVFEVSEIWNLWWKCLWGAYFVPKFYLDHFPQLWDLGSTQLPPRKICRENILNFPAHAAALHQKYIRGCVLDSPWNLQSDICPPLPWFLSGVEKVQNLVSIFDPSQLQRILILKHSNTRCIGSGNDCRMYFPNLIWVASPTLRNRRYIIALKTRPWTSVESSMTQPLFAQLGWNLIVLVHYLTLEVAELLKLKLTSFIFKVADRTAQLMIVHFVHIWYRVCLHDSQYTLNIPGKRSRSHRDVMYHQ